MQSFQNITLELRFSTRFSETLKQNKRMSLSNWIFLESLGLQWSVPVTQWNAPVVSFFLSNFGKCSVGSRSTWFLGVKQKKNCTFPIRTFRANQRKIEKWDNGNSEKKNNRSKAKAFLGPNQISIKKTPSQLFEYQVLDMPLQHTNEKIKSDKKQENVKAKGKCWGSKCNREKVFVYQ